MGVLILGETKPLLKDLFLNIYIIQFLHSFGNEQIVYGYLI